jgi:hypothetical protein
MLVEDHYGRSPSAVKLVLYLARPPLWRFLEDEICRAITASSRLTTRHAPAANEHEKEKEKFEPPNNEARSLRITQHDEGVDTFSFAYRCMISPASPLRGVSFLAAIPRLIDLINNARAAPNCYCCLRFRCRNDIVTSPCIGGFSHA